MNIEWLQDFQSLADTGNFTLAAQKQNVSQAAFSRRIQALESWVGVELIDRNFHPIRLTHAGQRFLTESTEVLLNLDDARTAISNPDLGTTAHVNIAMPHILSSSRFPKWWEAWSKESKTSVTISTGNISEIVSQFMTGSTDILICHNAMDFPLLMDPEHYLSHEMEKDRLSPYASRQFARKHESRFPGTEIAPVPLIRYTKGSYFSRLTDLLIKRSPSRLNSITQIETDMSIVIRDCISSGFGIGWLPDSCIGQQHKSSIRKIPAEGWSMDLVINAYIHRSTIAAPAGLLWERMIAHTAG